MSVEDKFKALKDKTKAAFYDAKGEAHLAKDDVERSVDNRTPLEKAGDKIADTIDRATDRR